MKIISPHEQLPMHNSHPSSSTTKKIRLIFFSIHESIQTYHFSLFRQSRPFSPSGPLFKDLTSRKETPPRHQPGTLHLFPHPSVAQAVKNAD